MKKTVKNVFSLFLAALLAFSCVGLALAAEPSASETQLRFDKNGDFKIMLVADTADIPNTRAGTRKLIEAGIEEQSPDLVVFLGNISSIFLGDAGDFINKVRYKTVLDDIFYPAINAEIPFAVVFGECEYSKRNEISLAAQLQYVSEYRGCLNRETQGLDVGNFNLTVAPSSGDGDAANLWFLNTSGITDNSSLRSWYLNTSAALEAANGEKVPSAVFANRNVSKITEFFSFDGKTLAIDNGLAEGYVTEYPSFYADFYSDIKARGDVFAMVSGAENGNCFVGSSDGMGFVCAGDSGFFDCVCDDPSVTFMTLDESKPGEYETLTRTYSDYFGADSLAQELEVKNYAGLTEEIGGFFKSVRSFFRNFLTAFKVVRRSNGTGDSSAYVSPAAPSNLSTASAKAPLTPRDGDFYISPTGNDSNDGSKASPFATIEKARDTIRQLKSVGSLPVGGVEVCLMAGEYRTDGIVFTSEDGGTAESPITYRAYGDGEVILNGGMSIDGDDFEPISGEAKDRLFSLKARKNVVMLDLAKYGITAEDYGKIYAIGTYNSSSLYDNASGPIYCELFFNDERMTLARYPNGNEFLNLGEIIDEGITRNNTGSYDSQRNPRGGTFEIDWETNLRINRYETFDDVWTFGYFKYDWADSSTPIAAHDFKSRTLTMEYCSGYGYVEGQIYYIFNALEELDEPGEWYLDRDNGVIYLYAPDSLDSAQIDLSLTCNTIITVENADYLKFESITVKGTRGDAISTSGNNNTVDSCLIKNISGNALIMSGYNNRAINNEITRTGKGGIILSGGDRETLTPGNNIADNNFIHDWSEIYLTYQPGVTLRGVGNICSHNEMCRSPHEAITYSGNNHIIEYNYLHDVVLQSLDAGAIYAGRSWECYGTVIRYNCITNLGSGDFMPSGIYMDDGLAGQSIYGNFLMNIPGNALQIGSGRFTKAYNNIILNARTPISYDNRGRDGALDPSSVWSHHFGVGGDVWKNLNASPYKSDIWAAAFPDCAGIISDFSDAENPMFGANPANSEVINNIIVTNKGQTSSINENVFRFSKMFPNAYFAFGDDVGFTDADNGIYTLRPDAPAYEALDTFVNLPFEKMGLKSAEAS